MTEFVDILKETLDKEVAALDKKKESLNFMIWTATNDANKMVMPMDSLGYEKWRMMMLEMIDNTLSSVKERIVSVLDLQAKIITIEKNNV